MLGGKKVSGVPAQEKVRAGRAYLVQSIRNRDQGPDGGRDPETEGKEKMNVIPEAVYRLVEKKLRKRWTLISKAEEAVARARAKATDISAPSGDGSGAGKGGGSGGSRTERGAMMIIRAEKRLEAARKWEAVFRKVDEIYPADSNEGYVAGMIYGNGMSQADLARYSGCSRQTVKLRQDRYVIRAAFLAAAAGLIREEVRTDGDADQKE